MIDLPTAIPNAYQEPVPAPIMTSNAGSFAELTVRSRMPNVVDRVLASTPYPAEICTALLELRQEMAEGQPICPLREETPDRPLWDWQWDRFAGHTWLQVPWLFSEGFFYRRLLEATRYFQAGPWQGRDPFAVLKDEEYQGNPGALAGLAGALGRLSGPPEERLRTLLQCNLWGNRADLTFDAMSATAYAGLQEDQSAGLLIDHRSVLWERLAGGVRRVDFINDNGGLELLFDLALADFLLEANLAGEVRFHLKSQPFFVSDAMIPDVEDAMRRLCERPELAALGRRLLEQRAAGRLCLLAEPFWTSCLGFIYLPADLRQELQGADLRILKGDCNYRRLLEDRTWPPQTSLAQQTAYFPRPFLSIRTIKAELMVDLPQERFERLSAVEPGWLTSGQYGLIQLVP